MFSEGCVFYSLKFTLPNWKCDTGFIIRFCSIVLPVWDLDKRVSITFSKWKLEKNYFPIVTFSYSITLNLLFPSLLEFSQLISTDWISFVIALFFTLPEANCEAGIAFWWVWFLLRPLSCSDVTVPLCSNVIVLWYHCAWVWCFCLHFNFLL